MIAAAHEALDRWGTGSGSARLIVGSRPIHSELERELAEWKETERSALFPTGFAANLGVLTTFGTRACSSAPTSSTMRRSSTACRLAAADVAVYRHRDLDHLRSLLRDAAGARSW